MAKHLAACHEREKAEDRAGKPNTRNQSFLQLCISDADLGAYWLYLEMRVSAKLQALDDYLRAIWLECCGHLSAFSTEGRFGGEIPMGLRADEVLDSGMTLTHIYDFGTSSVSEVDVLGVRKGKSLTSRPIKLLARNEPPEIACLECGQPASVLCLECMCEHDLSGALCDKHAKDHPHEDYGEPVSVYNSPRTGLCGYEGPAEPPY